MKIKSLELVNLKYMPSQKLEFNSGLNVITGANGTGKSVILNIINMLLDYIYFNNKKDLIEKLEEYKQEHSKIACSISIDFSESDLTSEGDCIISTGTGVKLDSDLFITTLKDLEVLKYIQFDNTSQHDTELKTNIESKLKEINKYLENNANIIIDKLENENLNIKYPLNYTKSVNRTIKHLVFELVVDLNTKEITLKPNDVDIEFINIYLYLIRLKQTKEVQDKIENIQKLHRSDPSSEHQYYTNSQLNKNKSSIFFNSNRDRYIKEKLQKVKQRAHEKDDNKRKYSERGFISKNESVIFNACKKSIDITSNEYLSGGENWISEIDASRFYLSENSFLIIDEPENSLHQNMQRFLSDKLYKIIGRYYTQVFIATHSPLFINSHEANIIRLSENGCKNISINNRLKSYYNENVINSAIFSDKVILVEGIGEYILINLIIDYYKFNQCTDKDLEKLNNISVIEVGGKRNFAYYAEILYELNNTNYYIVADLDYIEELPTEAEIILNNKELKEKLLQVKKQYLSSITNNKLTRQVRKGTKSKDTLSILKALNNFIKKPNVNNAEIAKMCINKRISITNRYNLSQNLSNYDFLDDLEKHNIFLLNYELESYLPLECKNEEGKATPQKMQEYFSGSPIKLISDILRENSDLNNIINKIINS